MKPGVIDCGVCTGELFIDSQTLHTPAWCVVADLTPLALYDAWRGENVTLPGASGRRAYRRRMDQAKHSLAFVITGVVDETGAEYPDPLAGFDTNLATLETIIDPFTTATQAAELQLPDGSTLNANVQADLVLGKRTGPVGLATLNLIIPSGRFT